MINTDITVVEKVIQTRFRGKMEFYKEMTDLFFETVDDELEMIRTAISSQNFEKIKFPAHYLKGGAINLGAQNVAEIADQLEQISIDEKSDSAHQLFVKLTEALEEFREFSDRLN